MNLKDFYIYNKKNIWISLIVIIVLIICIMMFFSKDYSKKENTIKDEYDLVLFGGSTVSINQDQRYQEPGFYALLNNKIVTEQVVVENPVDITKPGNYEIKYTYQNITRTRNVNVLAIEEDNNDIANDDKIENNNDDNNTNNVENEVYIFKLKGENEISLKINEKYDEPGVIFEDSKGNDISNQVIINGNVNTGIVGKYTITYSIDYHGKKETLKRIIVVNQSTSLTISNAPTTYTNKDVVLNIKVEGNNYSYLIFPNGSVTRDCSKTYTIKQNGTYDFYAYDSDGSYIKKTIIINKIDKEKPTGTCKAVAKNSKTTITVSAKDNNKINYYLYNGKYKSTEQTYTINSFLKSVTVTIYDDANNNNRISCKMDIIKDKVTSSDKEKEEEKDEIDEEVSSTSGNLEIHFMLTGHDDDGILIRTNNKTIMIDGGRYEDKAKVIPYLQKTGVKKIDLLIGSHVDYNHIQAQGPIVDNFKVSKAIYSIDLNKCASNGLCDSEDVKYVLNSLKKNNVPVEIVNAGKYIELGEMKLYFIGPLYKNKRHNKNSLVFILKFGNTKYLFMGDCSNSVLDTSKFQSNAKKWNLTLDVDVLKWPHHGYNDLPEEFIKATTPKYAMIPNGSHCSSKYPSSHNQSLMKKYNVKYYQTCDYGNMVIISDGKNINVRTNQSPSSYKR